ncbi:MAG: hypothetical protein CENE_03112 [Candidatus Celerinatantimonas neptuna]|nr:MAG: hypothetical protein CENE_03112 [Candidatus Celerinatantimonas neptuna]
MRRPIQTGLHNVFMSKILTDRLILTPVLPHHFDVFAQIMRSSVATRYLPKEEPYTDQEITRYVDVRVAHWQRGFGTYVVSLKAQPEQLLGYSGVEFLPTKLHCDIRYGLIESAQGQGIAYEAASAVVFQTFHTQPVDTIYGVAVEANLPSVHLIKKLGMKPASVELYPGAYVVTFSISRRRWFEQA